MAAVESAAQFDLDKNQRVALPGDNVDFTSAGAGAAGKDPVALAAQVKGSHRFGPASVPLGLLSAHLAFSSSARA